MNLCLKLRLKSAQPQTRPTSSSVALAESFFQTIGAATGNEQDKNAVLLRASRYSRSAPGECKVVVG